jgi:hypothetical protein
LIQTLISAGNFEKQCYLLKSFLSSPELKEHVQKLRIYQPEDEMKIKSFDNLAKVMSLSSPKKKRSITNETKHNEKNRVILGVTNVFSYFWGLRT